MTFSQKIRKWNHRRIDRMRMMKLCITQWLFSPFNRWLKNGAEQNILVLRLDGKLGDGVTATGFVRELKRLYPQSHICVVTGSGTEEVFRSLTYVDSVLTAKRGFLQTILLWNRLADKKYQVVFNTSHILNPRVVFLACMLRAEHKIGFGNAGRGIFSHHVDIDFNKDHITDRYMKALRFLKINPAADMSYQLHLRPDIQNLMKAGVADLRQKARFVIALNSFAGARLRNFNQKTTVAIVRKLLEYPDVKVISLANEGDHRILNQWIDQTYRGRWLNMPQFASLDQNVAILDQCDLIITPDTAWVHIASALKKKLVAVYREETNASENNAVIWAPFGTEFEVIRAPSTRENPDDINNVDTDQVANAAARMLGLQK